VGADWGMAGGIVVQRVDRKGEVPNGGPVALSRVSDVAREVTSCSSSPHGRCCMRSRSRALCFLEQAWEMEQHRH
jgi:hypothetical protein